MRFSPIAKEIYCDNFDCGNECLNHFLKTQAFLNQKRRLGISTLLINNDETIIGYYTLCPCHVEKDLLPKKFGGQLPLEIPAIKLARLAIDRNFQGKGYGGVLLAHSLKVAYHQSELLGGYVILIDAKSSAKSFYEKYGMKIIKADAHGLMMGMRTKDIPSYLSTPTYSPTPQG